jgi:hypothetical protein
MGASSRDALPEQEIVEIGQTDTNFWQNLHGAMDVGFNYTKQQNRVQYNFDSNVLYARTNWSAAADYESSFSGGGDLSNLRNDLRLIGTRQLRSTPELRLGIYGISAES